MQENTLKNDHTKMFAKLDDQIENRVVSKELSLNPIKTGSPTPGNFGADGEPAITQVFTR